MVLRNVSLVRAEEMDKEQRKEMKIKIDEGIVAIETHNNKYEQKQVAIKKGGLVDYILTGKQ